MNNCFGFEVLAQLITTKITLDVIVISLIESVSAPLAVNLHPVQQSIGYCRKYIL
jgi:hypothetical protein